MRVSRRTATTTSVLAIPASLITPFLREPTSETTCLGRLPLQEAVELLLPADRGAFPVPRNHHRLLRQRQQLLVNRPQNLPRVAARQISAANRSEEHTS